MKNILRSRFPLGGSDKRYPKWGYLNPSKIASKESYKNWKVIRSTDREGNPIFKVYNDSNAGGTGLWKNFNYVRPLVTGMGWSNMMHEGKNLVKKNGKLFSRQMPNGLENWIDRQRRATEKMIKEEISKL
jgi:hypothetical protein